MFWIRYVFFVLVLCSASSFATERGADSSFIYANGNDFALGLQDLKSLTSRDYQTLEMGLAHNRSSSNLMNQNYGQYIFPNEVQPYLVRNVLRTYPEIDRLIAVGSERCFLHAVFLNIKEKVYCYDYDHGVVMFNLINSALIAAARDLEEYRSLRLTAGFEVFQRALLPYVTDSQKLWLLFQFWQERVRNNPALEVLFHRPPTRSFFEGANYLYNEKLFLKVKAMIDRKMFVFTWINVIDKASMALFWRNALSPHTNLIDFSNIANHIGQNETVEFIRDLSRQRSNLNLFLWTINTDAALAWEYRYVEISRHGQPVTDARLLGPLMDGTGDITQAPAKWMRILPELSYDPSRAEELMRRILK